jgi:hypothetical protein
VEAALLWLLLLAAPRLQPVVEGSNVDPTAGCKGLGFT